jgi:hypothetical protein
MHLIISLGVVRSGEEPVVGTRECDEGNDEGTVEVPPALPGLPLVEATGEIDIERILVLIPTGEMDLALLGLEFVVQEVK